MIASITVTYQPDLAGLQKQLESLRDQIDHILVIDNGSAPSNLEALQNLCSKNGAHLYRLKKNTGIGYAQNFGIKKAFDFRASWLLLLDQDSTATPKMVSTLKKSLEENPKAIAAGPGTYDERSDRHYNFQLEFGLGPWPKFWKQNQATLQPPAEVAVLIASGTLIRASGLDSCEPMQADWFIDLVDTEWCLRMRSKGWILLGVPEAQMMHHLGDRIIEIWFIRKRRVTHHSPLRYYYMFRNCIFLIQKPYVDWHWKIYFSARLMVLSTTILIFTPKRVERLKMIASGIIDGLLNKTGIKK